MPVVNKNPPLSAVNFLPENTEKKKTKVISFKSLSNGKTYSAKVRKGTFTLKGRAKDLKRYEKDLENAKTAKSRLKRAGIAMLATAFVAGCVAAIIFGGPIGMGFGASGLLTTFFFADLILSESLFGFPLEYNFLFPVTAPIFAGIYLGGYEIRKKSKVKKTRNENEQIASSLKSKQDEIKSWLQSRKMGIEAEIKGERSKLHSKVKLEDLSKVTANLKLLESDLKRVNLYLKSLEESSKEAKKQA